MPDFLWILKLWCHKDIISCIDGISNNNYKKKSCWSEFYFYSSLSSHFCAGSTTPLSEWRLLTQTAKRRWPKWRGPGSWRVKLQPVWTGLCKTWHGQLSLRPTKALGASRPYFMRDPAKEEGNVCRRSPLPDVFRIWWLPGGAAGAPVKSI